MNPIESEMKKENEEYHSAMSKSLIGLGGAAGSGIATATILNINKPSKPEEAKQIISKIYTREELKSMENTLKDLTNTRQADISRLTAEIDSLQNTKNYQDYQQMFTLTQPETYSGSLMLAFLIFSGYQAIKANLKSQRLDELQNSIK